jgi:hypothetical protein
MLPVQPRISERRFMAQVVRLAELLGWRAWHDNATNAPRACKACAARLPVVRNAAGMLDLILMRRPRVVWAELKADRGKLTDEQLATLIELRASHQEAYVWKPSDWKTIERILR